MSTPFIAEVKLVSFNFAPKGWVVCNGQILPINQYQAIFSLLGVTFGGNGTQTFALPNLQGRTPISFGNGFVMGQVGGEESHTVLSNETPAHSHLVHAIALPGTAATTNPAVNYLAATTAGFYASGGASEALNSKSVTSSGGSQPHENRQPYLVMNWVIALQGIFPSRN